MSKLILFLVTAGMDSRLDSCLADKSILDLANVR
ncbi:hypothetical protein F0726_01556 [Acidithiobacillus caldus]|nr:hypothetical protein F0726_01556 [Acidithiobacillus caldus]